VSPASGVLVGACLAWDPRTVGAALSPTPIFNWLGCNSAHARQSGLAGIRVPRSCGELCPGRLFRNRRKTCSPKPHSDSPPHSRRKRTCRPPRCSASPYQRRGTGRIASCIDTPSHVMQRLSSGIKETVLRDRTEFPVKHAQLLDQEPPSQRDFSLKMSGLRITITGGARHTMNLRIVTLKMVPSPPALAAGLSLASAGVVPAK
jgi:hypothetical protein